jgi:hypothetical protein
MTVCYEVLKKKKKSEGLNAINNTNPCAGQLALHFFTFLKTLSRQLGLTLLVK